MKLYEIMHEIETALERATDEDGVIDEEALRDDLERLAIAKEEKINNCLWLYKDRKAMAEALKQEKLAIAKRQQQAEQSAERIREYLTWALSGSKWESIAGKISYRKTTAVEIDDLAKIPAQYTVIETKADKTAIKKAIADGEDIQGAHIEERTATVIK